MQACLNAATLRQGLSLTDFIAAAGAGDFRAIELRIPLALELVAAQGLPALRGALSAAGVTPAAGGFPVALRSNKADFATALANAKPACDLMKTLNIPGGSLVLPPRQGEGFTVERDETIERIGRVGQLAAEYGLDVYLEFLGLHFPDDFTWTKTLGNALDLAEACGQRNVGALIDSYHWHLGGSSAADLPRAKGRPILVHINDAPAGDVMTMTDPMRVLPGEGILDLPAWLRAIRDATGYDGVASLELFNEAVRALEPVEASRRSYASLAKVLAKV